MFKRYKPTTNQIIQPTFINDFSYSNIIVRTLLETLGKFYFRILIQSLDSIEEQNLIIRGTGMIHIKCVQTFMETSEETRQS